MVDFDYIVHQFSQNSTLFQGHFGLLHDDFRLWRPAPEKWCLHEILCHMVDEEREDFRARIESIMEDPTQPLVPIDPEGWVKSRKYMEKDYSQVFGEFVEERARSIQWLAEKRNAPWENTYNHNHFGPMSAKLFLHNWLAHDYLHLRQLPATVFCICRKREEKIWIMREDGK